MHTQAFATFLKDSKSCKTIPIVETFFEDTLTPVAIFQRLREQASYILESKEPNSEWARFSFIGLNPFMKIIATNATIELKKTGSGEVLYSSPSLKKVLEHTNSLLQVKLLDKNWALQGEQLAT